MTQIRRPWLTTGVIRRMSNPNGRLPFLLIKK